MTLHHSADFKDINAGMCHWTQTIYSYTCGCNWSSVRLENCKPHTAFLAEHKAWMKAASTTCGPEPVNKCTGQSAVQSAYEKVDSVCDNAAGCPSQSR